MKMRSLDSFLWLTLMPVLLSVLAYPADGDAGHGKQARTAECKYERKGEESPCNKTSNTKEITLLLKKGNPATCQPLRVLSKSCTDNSLTRTKRVKGCKYERKGTNWSECDLNTQQMTKILRLREGSSSHCPATHTKAKSCGKKASRKFRKGCVYNKKQWSECNASTNTRQREMVLVEGDPSVCLPKKVVTKTCKKAIECRYVKSEWSPCNQTTNQEQRFLFPRRGEPAHCEIKVESRSCQKESKFIAAKSNKCRYSFSEWTACDLRSNTMSQWITLKSGDPNMCHRTRKLTAKCKIACKFRQGNWSECDEQTQLTTRVDTLVKGNPQDCDLSREITKKCKKVCKYAVGDWGPCDPVTNHRTRVKKLIESDHKKCQAEEIVTKPCTKKDGEERCFFGPWGDFGPCTNGVMTKHRPVLQGGVACERKGVITKACDENS